MQPQAHLSMESMCRLAAVSRAGFYRHWHEREPCVEEMELRAQVQQIVVRHRRNYGYRRVARELRDQGWVVNRKRVARIMAEDLSSLLCKRPSFLGVAFGDGLQGKGAVPLPLRPRRKRAEVHYADLPAGLGMRSGHRTVK